MKKLLLLSLLYFNQLAAAEWVEIDSNHHDLSFAMFYEPSSIQKSGDISEIKILKNYKNPKNPVEGEPDVQILSTVSLQEIKCSTNKYRNKQIDKWSDLNGTGVMIKSYDYRG